jgi:Collagen triple helix repeat (20 copies)
MVIAMIALVVAAAGGGYAAAKLPKNSVGTAQLRNGSVTSAKVKNHSLLAVDFKPGQLERVLPTAIGPTGPTGPSGADGATGAVGATGDQGDSGPTGPVGDSGAQGPIGTQGAAGLSYGNTVVGAPTTSVSLCGSIDVIGSVVSPTSTSRLLLLGQAELSANGTTNAQLVTEVTTGAGSILGSADTGAPVALTSGNSERFTFSGIVMQGATAIDLPAGNYNVRLRLVQSGSGQCTPTVTATGADLTVLFVGTTQ